MKQCPLCKLKFEDDAQFCPACKAELESYEDAQKQESRPIPKSFWISLIAVFGFIGLMFLLYTLFYSNL